MDWRTTLPISDERLSAEQRFRAAFERLKFNIPQVLPKGTQVSQNSVAKEAGCDPSALKKARFPLLVLEIQDWVEAHKSKEPSGRQLAAAHRAKNRTARELIADLKVQRDKAVGLLADADMRIVELTERLAEVETKLALHEPNKVLSLTRNN